MTADEAAQRLVEWMNDPQVDMRERVRIAQDLLDRSGVSEADKLMVHVRIDPVEALFRSILERPDGLLETGAEESNWRPVVDRAQTAIDRLEEPIEAEVVDDPAESVAPPTACKPTAPPQRLRQALSRLI